jgi:hypothetical protein
VPAHQFPLLSVDVNASTALLCDEYSGFDIIVGGPSRRRFVVAGLGFGDVNWRQVCADGVLFEINQKLTTRGGAGTV